jgi:hypothetical protein
MERFMPTNDSPVCASRIPDRRDHRAEPAQYPIHCTVYAIELRTLADHHEQLAGYMRASGDDSADYMQARAAELRRLAEQAQPSIMPTAEPPL